VLWVERGASVDVACSCGGVGAVEVAERIGADVAASMITVRVEEASVADHARGTKLGRVAQ
jgi:hypothetical protein